MQRLRMDEGGASPLTVIAVVVLVVAGVTAVVVMSLVGGAEPAVAIQQVAADGQPPVFQVTDVRGGLDWNGLGVQFLDPAGVDRAALYLDAPEGAVEAGQAIQLRTLPPAGTYLLRIMAGDQELVRLAATF